MSRKTNIDEILEGRFIKRVLTDTSKDIDKAQVSYFGTHGFKQDDWITGREFAASENALVYAQLLKHRFVDMKTIETKEGKEIKKSHPVYNRIMWGHYNNIIRELSFGYTEAVKHELRNIENQ